MLLHSTWSVQVQRQATTGHSLTPLASRSALTSLPSVPSLLVHCLQGVHVRRQASEGLGATEQGSLFGIDLLEMEKGLQDQAPTSAQPGAPGSVVERVERRPWHVVGFEDAGDAARLLRFLFLQQGQRPGEEQMFSSGQVQPIPPKVSMAGKENSKR